MNAADLKTNMDWALAYAQRGWRVIPVHGMAGSGVCSCHKGAECDPKRMGKHPRTTNGFYDGTTDADQIRKWWNKWPTANIAIVTGSKTGLIVLDVDVSNGKRGAISLTQLTAKHDGVPQTLQARSGSGGTHLFFQFCPALPKSNDDIFGEEFKHIDCKSEDGYIIVEPSLHPSGGAYAFVNDLPLAEVPQYMIDAYNNSALQPNESKKKTGTQWPLEEVGRMLDVIPASAADNRDHWLGFGIVLGREYDRAPEAEAMYMKFCAKGSKAGEDPAGERERQHDAFHQRSQKEARGKPLTMGTIVALAKKHGWKPLARESDPSDADHFKLAQAVVEAIQAETDERPVYTRGDLWCFSKEGIWTSRTLDSVAMVVAGMFAGGKYCKRGGDFAAVAHVVAKLCSDDRFFEEAPVGIAAPSGFWRLSEAGEIVCEPLTAAHRQRMRVKEDPNFDAEPVVMLRVLREAFTPAKDAAEEQVTLVQQIFGCALTRSLWRHRIAVLFLGATNTGKSTLLTLLASVFPDDQIGACGPQNWGSEYYVASLAGIALNVVGDLDKKEPIPGYFKNVVGRDRIQGRHPTHRPFTFTCQASHIFNSNFFPPTADHSEAFFNRWRIVRFERSVAAEKMDKNLDTWLVQNETGAMLGWALRGAAEVMKNGRIIETAQHVTLLHRWRAANNSALAFILSEDCTLDATTKTPAQELFIAYRSWAQDNGMKPFGRNGFYEALAEGAGLAKIEVIPRESSDDHQVHVKGVKLAF